MANFKNFKIIIKPLSRYQGAVFPNFGGFWGLLVTSVLQ